MPTATFGNYVDTGTTCASFTIVAYSTSTYSITYSPTDYYQVEEQLADEERIRNQQLYEERERQAREQLRTTELQYQTVKERATRLLKSCLTQQQWQSLCDKEYFEVISKDGKRRYAIFHGHMGNVYRMEKGKVVARLCRHPWGVPDEDAMLAQKLELEHNYEQFERGANHHPLDDYRLRASGLAA